MADINLLIQKHQGFFSEDRLLLFSKVGAISGVVLVLSLSILFFLLSRDPSIAQVKADETRTIAQLTLLQSKTAKYLIVVDRIQKIKAIEKNKTTFADTISSFVGLIPGGATITNFTLDKHTLSLAVSASDLSLLGKAVDNFTSLVLQKKILKNLSIQGLVSDEKGGKYVLTLSGDLL
ncbi:MAG TPA: hypothetical protein VLB73_04395 [Patescibacteria group bacterium]|nr:hypothetical protein [Patescibacteria group bacterium]